MSNILKQIVDGLSGPLSEKFCSVFGIADAACGVGIAQGYWDGQPTYRTRFTDNAIVGTATFVGCTAAFSTGSPVRAVRAIVWLKNYRLLTTAGPASTGVTPGFKVQLQVAEGVAGFSTTGTTTNTGVIAQVEFPRATSCMTLTGFVPESGVNYSAARLAFFPYTGMSVLSDAASFDANIDAVPG